ncbi:MAG: sulfite exporter TauE/SafE family protein [Candidatus Paceibacterota bacterium]
MTYLYFALTFFAAGLVPELTGFGVATVTMPILSLLLPLSVAIPLVAIISMLVTGFIAYQTRAPGMYGRITALVVGTAIGVPLGMFFLEAIDEQTLSMVFGGFLIVYALYGLFARENKIPTNKTTGTAVGTLAGFFGATFNIHGPLVGLYAVSEKEASKQQIKGLIAMYMFISGVFTVIGHGIADRVTWEVLRYVLFSLPFLAAGMYVGSRWFTSLKSEWVVTGIYLFVLVAGIIILL